jgi:hypothetical protein
VVDTDDAVHVSVQAVVTLWADLGQPAILRHQRAWTGNRSKPANWTPVSTSSMPRAHATEYQSRWPKVASGGRSHPEHRCPTGTAPTYCSSGGWPRWSSGGQLPQSVGQGHDDDLQMSVIGSPSPDCG